MTTIDTDNEANALILNGLSVEQISKIPKWLLENYEKNKASFDKAVAGAIIATEKHARMNEHHIISGLLSNEDLRTLKPEIRDALKARFAEIKKG